MTEKQETLLETINRLKSDVDKGKEKSAQQKAHIRDLQQVCQYQQANSPHRSPYISNDTSWEKLFKNQDIPYSVITSFALMTCMTDCAVILQGEFRRWSLLVSKYRPLGEPIRMLLFIMDEFSHIL